MNICILTRATLTHQMGGTQVHCQAISEMAVEAGHSVEIITTRHPRGVEREQKNGFGIYYLPGTKIARLSKSWWREGANKIVQLHRKKTFDIIWAENLSGYYYAWRVKPLLRVPIVSMIQGLGILGHIRSGWNCISSFKEFVSFTGKYLPEAIFCYIPWFIRTLRYSDAIIGISGQTVKALKKEFHVDEKKLFVVYGGIDTTVFKPDECKREFIRNKFSLDEKDKVILMLGVVHKQKGMHIGLKAFCQIKREILNCKMMIVGDGPQLGLLKKLAKDLNIGDDVIFCGGVSNEETPPYYNAADLFLNPTVREEGLAIVIVEAMACGLPIVTSRIGGTASTIDEGTSGFFVEPKDEKMLVRKSIEILSNKKLAEGFGRDARAKALAQFSKEKMVADYLDISQRLIDKMPKIKSNKR